MQLVQPALKGHREPLVPLVRKVSREIPGQPEQQVLRVLRGLRAILV